MNIERSHGSFPENNYNNIFTNSNQIQINEKKENDEEKNNNKIGKNEEKLENSEYNNNERDESNEKIHTDRESIGKIKHNAVFPRPYLHLLRDALTFLMLAATCIRCFFIAGCFFTIMMPA